MRAKENSAAYVIRPQYVNFVAMTTVANLVLCCVNGRKVQYTCKVLTRKKCTETMASRGLTTFSVYVYGVYSTYIYTHV